MIDEKSIEENTQKAIDEIPDEQLVPLELQPKLEKMIKANDEFEEEKRKDRLERADDIPMHPFLNEPL